MRSTSSPFPTTSDGLKLLQDATELWGHNIIGYDIPAIQTIHPNGPRRDLSGTPSSYRAYSSPTCSIEIFDLARRTCPGTFTVVTALRHGATGSQSTSLSLVNPLDGDWSTFTPEMLEYCAQDVVVSVALVKLFEPKLDSTQASIDTEHKIAALMSWQEESGFPFDVSKAQKLESTLRTELDDSC